MEEKNLEKVESKPAFRHSIPVQMRFNDIDVLGHVNNSVFFTYYDLGKSAYFTTIRKGQMNWTRPDAAHRLECDARLVARFVEGMLRHGLTRDGLDTTGADEWEDIMKK